MLLVSAVNIDKQKCDIILLFTCRSASPDTKSEKSSATAMTNNSVGGLCGVGMVAGRTGRSRRRNKKVPEAFVSLQLEKVPQRDLMLNEFFKKKSVMGQILSKAEKVAEVKR